MLRSTWRELETMKHFLKVSPEVQTRRLEFRIHDEHKH
jgi:hypothetical protein